MDAGSRLARVLVTRPDLGTDVVVLGLPRGGVPVAFEVARVLETPLDVVVVRKLGVPFQPELAMGAIGEGGFRVVNDEVLRAAGIRIDELAVVEDRQRSELERRSRVYRGDLPAVPLSGRGAVIVDDGMATGSTMRAACLVARSRGATRVVVAVPVASRSALLAVRPVCDEVVCLESPERFFAVGEWYADFSQTSEEEVADLLRRARQWNERTGGPPGDPPELPPSGREALIRSGSLRLCGGLSAPANPVGAVLFAHGSGSSRHSPRNRYVAGVLNDAGITTLLLDLLTVDEESDRARVFDVEMLAQRLGDATEWALAQPETRSLPVGYFGASTGAAAALWAASRPGATVAAIVSRGGRPDLAVQVLPAVTAPTLLIVGGRDQAVLDMNRRAQERLRCDSHLAVVAGATHLFEEPGALEKVAQLARDWFVAQFVIAMRS
jgi:putative phosphoribosyl transferase